MPLETIVCQQCGKLFKGTPHTRFCPECHLERKREQSRRSWKKKRDSTRVTRICALCGEPFETYESSIAKYCEYCRNRRPDKQGTMEYEKIRKKSRIGEHEAAAKEFGVSYGTYMAMRAWKIKI